MWWLGETADERSLLNPVKTLKFSAILWHCSWAVESRAPSFKFSQGELRWLVTYRRGRHLTARGPPQEMLIASHLTAPSWAPSCTRLAPKQGKGYCPAANIILHPRYGQDREGLCALLLLNHRAEIQSHQLSHGCCTPGIPWYPTVPGQHVENSVKRTLPDQPHF